jgi:hypothetical protein
MAAAVTEIGTEVGCALGIAVPGSMGVAVRRQTLPGTLADAITRATHPVAERRGPAAAGGAGLVLRSPAAALVVALAATSAGAFLRPVTDFGSWRPRKGSRRRYELPE